MAGSKYDVIVVGGGHNGLVNAAYLAKAGKKVLVLERRHILGGAACTEEVFPGFKFSVCSYVVSLLRPEIIRDLDLPRHGLEILPLDGTFTPMPNGDYLWRVNDHGKTHREIARHSKLDAEAYDEFGKAMQAMCRFVKPILGMVPPDPATLNPRELMKLLFVGRRFQAMSSYDKYNQVQLMTMSAIDFLDQWFETDVLKATMSASGRAVAGNRLRAAASLHGRDRRRVSRVGICAGWDGRDLERDCRRGAGGGRGDSHAGADCADHREGWQGEGRSAREWR
jgi:phytoene dehydrogenase-like protein